MNAGALAGAAIVLWALLKWRARATRNAVGHRLAAPPADPPQRPGCTPDRSSPRDAPSAAVRRPWSWSPARQGDGVGLEEVCDRLARDLRSGSSLTAAVLDAAAEMHHPFLASVADSVHAGSPLAAAIDAAVPPHPDPDVALVAQVLAVAAEHGGAPAEAIDRAASTLRERSALRAERIAQAASARLSTRVMTVLPVGFTALVAAGDPSVRTVLLRTPIGWTCVALGLALNLLGRAWARRAMAAP